MKYTEEAKEFLESYKGKQWMSNRNYQKCLSLLMSDFAEQLESKLLTEKDNLYTARCNEVKDKVETIHKYLNQLTEKDEEIEAWKDAYSDEHKQLQQSKAEIKELKDIFKEILQTFEDNEQAIPVSLEMKIDKVIHLTNEN